MAYMTAKEGVKVEAALTEVISEVEALTLAIARLIVKLGADVEDDDGNGND